MKSNAIASKEIIDKTHELGFLGMQLYVIFTRPANGMEAVMDNLPAHTEYQYQLERTGVMFAAGPHWTDDGEWWEGEGMVVVRAASLDEAKKIAADDPMHSSGARTYKVRPWMVNEGKLTLEIGFASGRFRLT